MLKSINRTGRGEIEANRLNTLEMQFLSVVEDDTCRNQIFNVNQFGFRQATPMLSLDATETLQHNAHENEDTCSSIFTLGGGDFANLNDSTSASFSDYSSLSNRSTLTLSESVPDFHFSNFRLLEPNSSQQCF